jgi:hypothetical protein
VHQFDNHGAESERQLSVVTPGSLGPDYFREMGEILNRGGPPNTPLLIAIMLRHGLNPVLH